MAYFPIKRKIYNLNQSSNTVLKSLEALLRGDQLPDGTYLLSVGSFSEKYAVKSKIKSLLYRKPQVPDVSFEVTEIGEKTQIKVRFEYRKSFCIRTGIGYAFPILIEMIMIILAIYEKITVLPLLIPAAIILFDFCFIRLSFAYHVKSVLREVEKILEEDE